MAGLIDHNLLVIFVHGAHLHATGHQDVSVHTGIAYLIDTLSRSKRLQLHLGGQNGNLFLVKQRKKWDVFQLSWVTRHGSPRSSWICSEGTARDDNILRMSLVRSLHIVALATIAVAASAQTVASRTS